MRLFSALRSRIFPPELCRVAKSGDVPEIVSCLARTSVVVIAADLGDSVPLNAPRSATIAIVKSAAERKSFDGDIHKYEIDGEIFLPVFTDAAAAETFCGAYVGLLGRIHAFRLFKVPGNYLRHWIADQDIIVVNPQSSNEVEMQRGKSEGIRAGLPEIGSFNQAEFVSVVLPMAGISQSIEFGPEV